MKKMLLVLTAAMATTACAPGMFSVPARGYPLRPHYARPAPQIEPVPIGRWDNVMRLPRGSTVDVLTSDGAANVGATLGADVSSVRLVVDGVERRIERTDIVRVDLVDLAGSETRAVARKAARGALLGVGFAALVTGVVGGELWPPPGAALRAGAAIGGVGAGQTELLRRAGRLIYLAPDAPVRLGTHSLPKPSFEAGRSFASLSSRKEASMATTGSQLESWSGFDWSDGVQIDDLHELDALSIRTRNSTYEIVVTAPAKGLILVRGGAHFPSFTAAKLRGSTVGGCLLKSGGVYPGFRLELEADGRRIITSAVESIDLNVPSSHQ